MNKCFLLLLLFIYTVVWLLVSHIFMHWIKLNAFWIEISNVYLELLMMIRNDSFEMCKK